MYFFHFEPIWYSTKQGIQKFKRISGQNHPIEGSHSIKTLFESFLTVHEMPWLTQATSSPVSSMWGKKSLLQLLLHNGVLLQGWFCSAFLQMRISGYLWCWRQGQLIWTLHLEQRSRTPWCFSVPENWGRGKERRLIQYLSTISKKKILFTTEKIRLHCGKSIYAQQ